ncbi:MAG: MOSC domain-containing protein [Pseudonocardia sp.]|nr:MOSC domain-containing protein [Pseudonocardia sp.]
MATLLSVNVGLPRDVTWNGRTVHTGIWKQPVSGPVMARRLNLDGDGQGDLNGHGGEQRAVMVYQAQSYEHWRNHLGRTDLEWGVFGENFTVDGLADGQVCIGDRYRIGEAEFEVTQPRVTCYRVGLRLEEPRMPALLVAHHRPGFYLRVLQEGRVQAGDPIVKIGGAAEQISVATTDAQLYLPDADPDTMRGLLRVDALSPGWQGSFRDLVDRIDHPHDARRTPSEVAWNGFRSVRVARLVHETDLVTSVYLRPNDGEPLPPPLPGQYLAVRLPADPPVIRNYSLSASTADGYRISVKREPKGVVSSYIATALAVGDQVDIAAPRGEFVLGDGGEPVVLLSAGIGVTPVLAMLHALAAQHSTREVWWLHSTRGRATHALADEARRLLEALPNARSHIFYTAEAAAPRRLDRSVLERLGLPVAAQAYVCGPAAFMDAMTAALADLGLAGSHIHIEQFTSLAAITPGVVATARPAPHAPGKPGNGPLVTFARAGLTVAFDDEACANLLEIAEACDVPTRWSCRTGVCHTCATPLLSGAVDYSPPPLSEPDPGEVLLCCAQPRVDVVLDL